MSFKEHFSEHSSKWYVAIPAVLVLYLVLSSIQARIFAYKRGCKAPAYAKGGRFGLVLLKNAIKAKNEGTLDRFSEVSLGATMTSKISLGGVVPVILTRDPENIKALLGTQFNDFALGTRHAHFKPLLGDGIFTLDGQGWKDSRSMLRPQFSREQVAHVRSLEPHIQLLRKHIQKFGGKEFDIQEYFFKFTIDTATEFLFGESVDTLKDASIGEVPDIEFAAKHQFADSFNVSQVYLSTRAYSQIFYFLINNKEFRESNSRVHDFTNYFVDKVLESDPEKLSEMSKGGYTFLYELAKQTRDRTVLRDQALNILLAGRDTTAGLLSFTFYELSRNPVVWETLRTAVLQEFGSGTEEDISNISFETLKKCEYLKWVLNEALRLYPSVPNNFRVATKNTTLPKGGGKDESAPIYVGKGTTVAYSIIATHQMEAYYGRDAKVFKPERWATQNKLGWAYLPFNGGPRICLGQQFALTEASYVVVRLCQMFSQISTTDTVYPPKKNIQLTMCLQDGAHISLS
ncbi:hypothetical protein PSN45_000726 [Yamadazyma tenuis]|nr:hypothetical protein PSN45_000726 [Yamadazyma tenuis]